MRPFRRFAALGPGERWLLIRAVLAVAAFRLALCLLPGRTCFKLSRTSPRPDPVSPARCAWAVHAAARRIPRATCLTQALALHWLLSRSGHASVVKIGVAKESGRFHAHAWVEHEGRTLLNTPAEVASYAPLAAWGAAR